jgi:hypothetical protein
VRAWNVLQRLRLVLSEACALVRRFRDPTIKAECKSDYPHALQALWKALDRAEEMIQKTVFSRLAIPEASTII